MAINLIGNWQSGKAYDLHTVSSTFLGTDERGHDCFDTTRSAMGQLVYRLKYASDQTALAEIVTLLDDIKGIENFDYLVPIPATNKKRIVQPVDSIAVALGKRRGVAVLGGFLENTGNEELKGISDPVERHERLRAAMRIAGDRQITGKSLLLIDDLYRSGTTLMIATDLLYNAGKAGKVCVLAMTKTRSTR